MARLDCVTSGLNKNKTSLVSSLWQTFFTTSVGAQIPLLAEMQLSACGCRQEVSD
jgi:hypothetical protein